MKIGIVEDEAVWRDKVQAAVEAYCREKNISFQIESYGTGKDFLKNADADLLFLDIELAEGEDGFAIAERLMESGSRCKVCFLTSHTEFARSGYRVNAFRYIDKKRLEEIDEALGAFLKTRIQDRIISCNDASGLRIAISLNEILLVETYGRKLRYLMRDGREYVCEGRISETAQSLAGFGFARIHRSYLVNLKYIEKVNSREVTLCNGLKAVIGRAYGREFQKEFFQWRLRFGD
ncbi:MAG: LytTR family DNA-binding domain-containing protein [Lachnospiraceae bacterium]|nr:LytTR family DNA-binding domain-containing protein [Lachnospiraceae bacterium]MCM1240583.1 LytTR family DNA-binding domain-containing protein [Lachnospiraceae bacterium]